MDMASLTMLFFAQFAALALLVPPLVHLADRHRTKIWLALGGPVVLLPLVLVSVAWGLLEPNSTSEATWLAATRLQMLALAFAGMLAGVTLLLARPWPQQAPIIVALAALLLLSTPLWGNPLLGLSGKSVNPLTSRIGLEAADIRTQSARVLSAANPLFTVSQHMGYDWMRSENLMYGNTRLGEDLTATPTDWLYLSLIFGALGLLAYMLAALVRDRERPSLYLPAVED